MSLIAMAVYCTAENMKEKQLACVFESLFNTVNLSRHRIMLSVNGHTEMTRRLINSYDYNNRLFERIIWNDENIGTAEAINRVWKHRRPGEHAVKMDDDVVINYPGWADELEAAILRDPLIGICGLKRKDCIESPDRTDFYHSELYMLPHKAGEPWIIGERVNHVMGTCQMYSSALLDKIGYLYQPALYGFDDVFAAIRCNLAGFQNVFLPHIDIDHLDRGDTPYQQWKEEHTREQWTKYQEIAAAYKSGERSIYYNPFERAQIENALPNLSKALW